MSEVIRQALIRSFDQVRPGFLAAIDQIVAEMRPKIQANPDSYPQSVIACAVAFAEPASVRQQLLSIEPELEGRITNEEIADAHLASVAYLFSLALHEMIRNHEELPR